MTLTFTPEQLAIIDRALTARPYGEVASLIADINRQLAASAKGNEKEGSGQSDV